MITDLFFSYLTGFHKSVQGNTKLDSFSLTECVMDQP